MSNLVWYRSDCSKWTRFKDCVIIVDCGTEIDLSHLEMREFPLSSSALSIDWFEHRTVTMNNSKGHGGWCYWKNGLYNYEDKQEIVSLLRNKLKPIVDSKEFDRKMERLLDEES